jgi:hypothetical protein
MKVVHFKSLFFLSALLLINGVVYPQEYPKGKFELSGGFGWPEMGVLKIKYGQDFQIGISQGFMLDTSLEIFYHFAGKPLYTDQRVWYGMAGIEYFYWGWESNNWLTSLRLGRTFNLSRRYGINIDIGAFYLLNEDDFFSKSHYSPSGSVTFFFRL